MDAKRSRDDGTGSACAAESEAIRNGSTLTVFFPRLWAQLVCWKRQNDQVAPLALIANLRFVTWFLGLLMLMAGAGAWLSFEGAKTLPLHQADPLRLVAWLDLAAVAFFAVLLAFKKYLVPEAKLGQVAPGLLALVCLLVAGLWSFLAQWFMPSVTLYALGCCFVGTLLLIRPATTLLIYGLSFAMMSWALGQSPVTGLLLATERLYAGFASTLGVVLSLVLWHRFTTAEMLRIKVQAQRLQLEMQNHQLQNMAMLDALTGLLNRRAFEVQAEQAISRARRDGTSLAALMLDLDHFKSINDQYGHPAGDAVIKFTADVLGASVRDTDMVARVGGEEFMVLLPVTSPEAALDVAEKIRQRVSQTPHSLNTTESIYISVSVGVACFAPGKMGSFESLYAQADRALYEAKRLGRNRVVQSGECAGLSGQLKTDGLKQQIDSEPSHV